MVNSDSIRYHIINNGPEKKDTNFTLDDFERTHNSEILNKFGNLINRTLKFKGLEEIVKSDLDEAVESEVKKAYKEVGADIESLEFKAATDKVMQLVEFGNRYYDEKQPWIQKKENEEKFNKIIYNCVYIIANLSNLFEPFMPASCQKIRESLELGKPCWEPVDISGNIKLENIEPLFNRI